MSKITFRADDDLIEELESLEISKSEAMREALRSYLGEPTQVDSGTEREANETAIDDLVRDRVDELLTERLETRTSPHRVRSRTSERHDLNLSISFEGVEGASVEPSKTRTGSVDAEYESEAVTRDRTGSSEQNRERTQCGQCGEHVDDDHVYCPNCGEKASRRLFCECGDELRSDWSFCPSCGRRTPAADVLESG
ncbi:CopG family transcriptional regulator [Natrarchaeobius halalkaliphilus]|uniref:CopG family transcriptional regulator n=1 Tax=Natrarchaeobius halalkaliphilus TaxID=1679091 RepID=A0A3N6M4G4_9EURY|nr:zinc ribbon domain-containing protein [Natrarchaeobius halalkaliphilus]RQG87047.1 CopG family transcriptional regulator [Natrarchaeobius halalkaliphilus]